METYMYSMNDYRSYLKHYGVPEQKWGVRRYQNEDGSLTPLGREHYGVGPARGDRVQTASGSKKDPSGVKALEKGPSAYKSKKAYLEAITNDCLYNPINLKAHENDKQMRKRVCDAADLGLEAIENLRGPGYIDWESDPDPKFHREWFIFEDQTIGMHTVSDLINNGYSAKQVEKLINEVNKNFDYDLAYSDESTLSNVMFQVREGGDEQLKEFARECEKVKKNLDRNGGINLPKDITVGKSKDLVMYQRKDSDGSIINYPSAWMMSKKQQKETIDFLKNKDDRVADGTLVPLAGTTTDSIIVYDTKRKTFGKYNLYDGYDDGVRDETHTFNEQFNLDDSGKRVSVRYGHKDNTSQPIDRKELSRTGRKLTDLDAKLDKDSRKIKRFEDEFDEAQNGFVKTVKAFNALPAAISSIRADKKIEKLENKVFEQAVNEHRENDNDFKYSSKVREAMQIQKSRGWKSLTDSQKKILEEIFEQYE